MKNKYKKNKKLRFLSLFLIADIFVLLLGFNTSGANYTSEAVGVAEVDVAMYAFSAEKFSSVKGDEIYVSEENVRLTDVMKDSSDIMKYYKFSVFNKDENDKLAEVNLKYDIRLIATTNIEYDFYLFDSNPSAYTDAQLRNNNLFTNTAVANDAWGTPFLYATTDLKNMNYGDTVVEHVYYLVVKSPSGLNVDSQDIADSIKIQLRSSQIINEG